MERSEPLQRMVTSKSVSTTSSLTKDEEESFHLRWSHFPSNVLRIFDGLLHDQSFADLTLVCSHPASLGDELKAHKVVLSACSAFFKSVLVSQPVSVQPVLILPSEISGGVMRHLLDFVYRGEVDVHKDVLQDVLQAANLLQIKGLHPEEMEDEEEMEEHRGDEVSIDIKEEELEEELEETSASASVTVIMDEENDSEEEATATIHKSISVKQEDEDEDEDEEQQMNDEEEITQVVDEDDDGCGRRRVRKSRRCASSSNRSYTSVEMTQALAALRSRSMTLSQASSSFGIPPTTLWQKAARQGIATASRRSAELGNRNWKGEALNHALAAMRNNEISVNRAAKVFGIPSSTLYKIARKEGIALATPFNAVQTTWNQEDLTRALDAIRKGMAVQRASVKFGIPSGTLYGRCRKFGIELAKTSPAPWSEDAMFRALESVRCGRMSINQAAIHHCLPYSSLYGRINKLKREQPQEWELGVYAQMGHVDLNEDGDNTQSRRASSRSREHFEHL